MAGVTGGAGRCATLIVKLGGLLAPQATTASHFGEQDAVSHRLRSKCPLTASPCAGLCIVSGRGLTEADQLSLFLSTAASSSDKRLTGRAEMGDSSNCADNLARASAALSAAFESLRKAAVPIVVVAKSMPHWPKDALLTPPRGPESILS